MNLLLHAILKIIHVESQRLAAPRRLQSLNIVVVVSCRLE